jgi:preprotein translocase subunit Sec61beta
MSRQACRVDPDLVVFMAMLIVSVVLFIASFFR